MRTVETSGFSIRIRLTSLRHDVCYVCATPPRRKSSGAWISHPRTRRNLSPAIGVFPKLADVGGFSLPRRPKAKGRPPKAVLPSCRAAEKNRKKVRGAFDFAIWHGIVVSCSGKATRVNTTSPHSPNPHRRDSKRVKPVPVSLLRRVLAAFPGHSPSFNSKHPIQTETIWTGIVPF